LLGNCQSGSIQFGAETDATIELSQDIHSLSEFKRKTAAFLAQMRESGRPVVLTVNGKAEFVIQDVAGYQRLLEPAE
jgi:prevent-host-death family protein